MAWIDDLLEAALSGVPFFYEEVTSDIGRRGTVHEFMLRDDPFAEDHGRAADRWSITAFVLGDDYMIHRDLLIELIRDSAGPHVFTHPYQGDKTVRVERCRVREHVKEAGMASFDLQLVEAGIEFPLLLFPTPARIQFLADAAVAKMVLKTPFNLFAAIGAVLASVAAGLQSASSLLRKVNGKIASALDAISNVSASIDELLGELDRLMQSPQALMNALTNLTDSIFALVTAFTPDPASPGAVETPIDLVANTMEALESLFEFSSDTFAIPTPTPQSTIERDAHAELSRVFRGAALASASKALGGLTLESAQQSQAIAQNLAEKFEQMLSEQLDEDVHQSFAALKAATLEHFTETARLLPQIVEYVAPATTHALVLAYELGCDVDDLIRRNRIRHPAFIFGGRALEVLGG
jgi:prophage DNA circulation protein